MTQRPLLIDDRVRQNIKTLIAFAEGHQISRAELHKIKAKHGDLGDIPLGETHIPQGYICRLSIEHQPIGICRHLSIRVDGEGDAPNDGAVTLIMREFGFRGDLIDLDSIWLEPVPGIPYKMAVNVLQLISPDVQPEYLDVDDDDEPEPTPKPEPPKSGRCGDCNVVGPFGDRLHRRCASCVSLRRELITAIETKAINLHETMEVYNAMQINNGRAARFMRKVLNKPQPKPRE